MDTPQLSVAIPVYNDVTGLQAAVPRSVAALEKLEVSFEILIVEDASTDGSREAAEAFAATDSRIRLNHSDQRRGKGGALTEALQDARGEIFCFYDVDLSTDLRHLGDLLRHIQAGDDLVIGSRFLADSTVRRTGDREVTSRGFNTMVRILLGSRITDHQCGFKAFRRDRLMQLMPYVHARGWTWDTEVLALAQACGFRITELPVIWTQGEKTNVQTGDIFAMGWEVLRLAWRLRILRDYPKV